MSTESISGQQCLCSAVSRTGFTRPFWKLTWKTRLIPLCHIHTSCDIPKEASEKGGILATLILQLGLW